MDIIAAHRQGLIEQLDEEGTALAGRPRDHGQRAVVLHHLYNHSGGQHLWALAEALQELRIGAGIATLRQRLARWGWAIARRAEAREALDRMADAMGRASAARTAAALRAYRLGGTTVLRAEAEELLPAGLLTALEQCHRARRLNEPYPADALDLLKEQSEQLGAAVVDSAALEAAWSAIEATGLKRMARRLLGDRALLRKRRRDEQKGWVRLERLLLADRALPASFRYNPAQHFYALQRMLQNRRRQEWREACDREPDAFELAA